MIISINGTIVTIKGNPTTERNIQEELDTGKLVINSTRKERYEMYDKVDVTTPFNDVEQYLIQADNPVQLNATEYEHNLTLFENIAYFNNIYPADRSFKVVGQTIGDILLAYQRELEGYNNIDITWDTIPQAVLDETIPFKEFAGLNLSSILLSIFRKIWAVPKVNRVGSVWDIYPLYHSNRNNSIASESISKMSQQNNVDYATKVKSQLKNAVNERTEGEVTWFPSASGYVLPRTNTLVDSTSDLQYELDSNIIAVLKVEAVEVHYKALADGESVPDDFFLDIDITSQVVQDEVYDKLKVITSIGETTISTTNNIKNNIRFKVGERFITDLYKADTDSIIFTSATRYLKWAIMRKIYTNGADYFPANYGPPVIQAIDEHDIKLRVKYVRQRNIDLIHNRKTKGAMNDITTIHQQRDASVEVNEYKKNLKIYSNRMGNNKFSKTKIFTYPDEPYKLFDYTDNKTIVTRVQNTWHNKWVYCEYEESVDFSNIEAEYALMRRTDPYTINTKAVTTNLIVQEFLEFSFTSRTNSTKLTSNAQRLLSGLFESTTLPYSKVAVGVFKPILLTWNSNYAIHMPVEASGDGGLITVHIQFPHQSIAGKTYYDLDSDTYKNYLNPLPYTDVDGRLEDYELYFTPDVLFEDAGQYPLILDQTNYLANKYTLSGISEPIDLDSAASFAQTLQVSLIADENIYIGNAVASKNYFIKDQATTTAPKIYTSTKPYGQYDQAPRIYDTDNTANISYTYSYTNGTITITPSIDIEYFSIVKDDDILLAINKSILAGTTVIIQINHINDSIFVIVLNVATTAEAFVDMSYSVKLNIAVSLSATAIASVNMSYITAKNIAVSLSNATTASSTILYTEVKDIKEILSVTADSNVSIVFSQLNNIIETLSNEAIATVSITFIKSNDIAVSLSATAQAVANTTYVKEVPTWVEVSPTTPTPNTTCDNVTDIDNIKIETECVFIGGESYAQANDGSTPIPACSNGATYTLCLPVGSIWVCTDYTGEETDTYYQCQLVEVA